MQTLITNHEPLLELAAELQGTRAIALDTEFLRERTYRAELCLLQIAAADHAVCVDPLALGSLDPLAPVLAPASQSAPQSALLPASQSVSHSASTPVSAASPPPPEPLKVMHASRQDIEVLLPAVGLVRPVFDTQIAAALAGFPAQIGYGELVRRILGVELAKAHTRADWSARPLSDDKIAYALDDVRYLVPLQEHLTAELERMGRSAWLAEELAALADAREYTVEPRDAWRRLKGLAALDADRARLARELAAWREERASERNRPRGWILEDAVLREIILAAPRSAAELAAIPGMPSAVVKHCGAEILQRIRAANLPDALPPLNLRRNSDPRKLDVLKRLAQIHRSIAADLALSPEVLATRRDLEQLAGGREDNPLLQGWRRSIIGERLLAAL